MKKALVAVVLMLFPLSVAFGREEVWNWKKPFLISFYALTDIGPDNNGSSILPERKTGGGAFITYDAFFGFEVDSVPLSGNHYTFVGAGIQSPAFFIAIPARPVFSIGVLDRTIGGRIGLEVGDIVPLNQGEALLYFFLGPSLWRNIDGLQMATFTIGVGF